MKLIFEYLTSSFALFEDPIKNYIVIVIIGFIAYTVAYSLVGKLYKSRLIYGRETGHVLHWIIRLIVFAIIFYVSATIMRIYNWYSSLPDYKWWIVGAIVALIILGIGIRKCFDNNSG